MPPFFMSIVSGADHWLFVASTGGLLSFSVFDIFWIFSRWEAVFRVL